MLGLTSVSSEVRHLIDEAMSDRRHRSVDTGRALSMQRSFAPDLNRRILNLTIASWREHLEDQSGIGSDLFRRRGVFLH